MAAVANIENLDRREDTGFGLACHAALSRFILVLAYCIVACALLSVILDVDFFEFVNSIFCRCTILFVDWGFYVSLSSAVVCWHFLRRTQSRLEFIPQSHIPSLAQGSVLKSRGSLLAALFLGIVVFVSLLVRSDSEIVGDVKWRYDVVDGRAIIMRGRILTQFRAAISTLSEGGIEIPRMLGGYPVTSIGDSAFYKCARLKSVAIPKCVTNVAYSAFNSCSVEKIYVEKGDADRVRELLRGKGVDVDKVEFVEREAAPQAQAAPDSANGVAK